MLQLRVAVEHCRWVLQLNYFGRFNISPTQKISSFFPWILQLRVAVEYCRWVFQLNYFGHFSYSETITILSFLPWDLTLNIAVGCCRWNILCYSTVLLLRKYYTVFFLSMNAAVEYCRWVLPLSVAVELFWALQNFSYWENITLSVAIQCFPIQKTLQFWLSLSLVGCTVHLDIDTLCWT